MDNVTFSSPIPTRAVYDMSVDDVCTIINSNFTTIHSGAFIFQGNFLFFFCRSLSIELLKICFTDMNAFRFQGNYVEELTGASLQMPVKQSVVIQDNTIIALSSSAFRCEFLA